LGGQRQKLLPVEEEFIENQETETPVMELTEEKKPAPTAEQLKVDDQSNISYLQQEGQKAVQGGNLGKYKERSSPFKENNQSSTPNKELGVIQPR